MNRWIVLTLALLCALTACKPHPVVLPEPIVILKPSPVPAVIPDPERPSTYIEVEPLLPAGVPPAARLYRIELVAESRRYWGSSGPVADFAGQIHQESAWRKDARSPYASGLTQFTPDTADWIAGMDPELREANPLNPNWAIKALVVYDRHLYKQWPEVKDACRRMSLALQGYNAGPGWIKKEAAAGRCLRAPHNCAETDGYHRKILFRWAPLYTTWGARSCS